MQHYQADMDLAGALSVKDYKDDPRQSTRPLDRFEGDTDRVWGTYTQQLGAMGPFDSVEFSWTNFAHNSYRNFVVGLPFTPDGAAVTKQDGPRDFKVWGSEPRLSMSIDGDSLSQTWLLGARYVQGRHRLQGQPPKPRHRQTPRHSATGPSTTMPRPFTSATPSACSTTA